MPIVSESFRAGRALAGGRWQLAAPIVCTAQLLCACSATWHEAKADRSVERILSTRSEEVLRDREATVRVPESIEPTSTESGSLEPGAGQTDGGSADEGSAPLAPLQLDLAKTLELAIDGNRGYRSEIEGLYLSTLSLVGTRHSFSPQLSAVLSYLYSDASGSPWSQGASLGLGASQILPTGGDLSVSFSGSFSDSGDQTVADPDTFSAGAGIRLTQPLLRGAGREVALEPLVQAERNLVYAIREFELFREGFSIEVAQRYYDLVDRKQAIDNQRRNFEDFVFERKKAEALFNVGRQNELNVLRARREELNSQNRLIEEEEAFQDELDSFRIYLGLEDSVTLDIRGEVPEFVPVTFDPDSAAEVALQNRLDVLSRREQLEDSERGLRISAQGLRPDLDLTLSYDRSAAAESRLLSLDLDDESFSAGLSMGIPVDRVSERNSYRSAQISHARALRSFEEFEAGVVFGVRSALRTLKRLEQTVQIQEQLISDEEKGLRIAQLQFERGDADNRDVVDAQESLLAARNTLVSEKVRYEIARLRLLRDLGILFIDDKGMWKP